MDQNTAERRLQNWADARAQRDAEIVLARLLGLSKARIHEITGMARTTIDRILEKAVEEMGGTPVLVIVEENQEDRFRQLVGRCGAVGEPLPNNAHPTWRVHDGHDFVNPHAVTSVAVKLAYTNPIETKEFWS